MVFIGIILVLKIMALWEIKTTPKLSFGFNYLAYKSDHNMCMYGLWMD